MLYVLCFALGIIMGVYITSIRFRLRIGKSCKSFVQWIRDVIERNKKIRQQEEEINRLRGVSNGRKMKLG